MAPANTPLANTFANSNIAAFSQTDVYNYFNCSSFQFLNNGFINSALVIPVYYSDPIKELEFPFSYQDQFIDSFLSDIFYDQQGYSWRVSGVCTVVADGFGTLITPFDTIVNVLRVYYYTAEIDTQWNLGAPYAFKVTPGLTGGIIREFMFPCTP